MLYLSFLLYLILGYYTLILVGCRVNISDVGKIPDPVRIDRTDPGTKPKEPDRTREEEPVRKELTELSHDEYVSSVTSRIRSASYNVYDVRQGKVDDLRARIQEGTYHPDGEKVAQKLIDMILSTGRKNLRIYRTET